MRLESQMIVKTINNSLFKQDDFRNQRCLLREVIESRGHKVVFIGEMLSVMLEEIVIILGEVTKDSTRGIGSNFFKANSWLCAKVFPIYGCL